MLAEKFQARLNRLCSNIRALKRLAEPLPRNSASNAVILGRLESLASDAERPLILAFVGPFKQGRTRLIEKVFPPHTVSSETTRPTPVRLFKHKSAPAEEALPSGVEEFFVDHPALEGVVLLELDTVENSGLSAAEAFEELILQVDVLFFCFYAEDSCHAPTLRLLEIAAEQPSTQVAMLLLDAGKVDHTGRAQKFEHLEQVFGKKFSTPLPILEVNTCDAERDGFNDVVAFIEAALTSGHPSFERLNAAEAEATCLALEIERGLRNAATELRDEEFKLAELDRQLIAQHNWLRLQIDSSVSDLFAAANAAIERASELFENETSFSRIHNIFARLTRTARDLQEAVSDALGKLLTPRLEAIAVGLKEQIETDWLANASTSLPALGERIREALQAGPRLDELGQICRTKMALHLGATIAGQAMEEFTARLISQSCSSLLLPVVILFSTLAAGLASAFQIGCELAGGALICLGLLGALWAGFSGMNIRKIFAKQYRQMLVFRTQHAVRLMQEEVRSFGTTLLDEIGRRVSEAADDLAASRKFLEPVIAEAANLASLSSQTRAVKNVKASA